MGSPDIFRFLTKFIRLTVKITAFAAGFKVIYRNGKKQVNIFPPKKVKRSLVQSNQKKVVIGRNSPSTKSEEVIGRNSPTKNGARLLVATVTLKKSEEVIGRNSPTKNSEEVIGRNSPTKK